ncbi:MAG: hypothetical protein KGZ50_09840 [Peptococcaceae bacterium]|nr:hypothetical protein [Peptococcaceae bacterium]
MFYRAGNNAKKFCGVVVLVLATISFSTLSGMASWPNFGNSVHNWSGLFFDGYVQCQPAYIDNGFHAARGFFVYRNGRDGERWAFTSSGQNSQDGAIYSAQMRYWDTLNPLAPRVTFNYGFDWVPFGSGMWINVVIETPAEELGSDE